VTPEIESSIDNTAADTPILGTPEVASSMFQIRSFSECSSRLSPEASAMVACGRNGLNNWQV